METLCTHGRRKNKHLPLSVREKKLFLTNVPELSVPCFMAQFTLSLTLISSNSAAQIWYGDTFQRDNVGVLCQQPQALSSLQATVTNFAANFISSGLAGYFLFHEPLPSKVTWEFSIFFAVHHKDHCVSIYLLHL